MKSRKTNVYEIFHLRFFFSIFQNGNIIYECTYIKEGNTLTEKLGDFGEDEGGGELYFMSSLIVSSFYVLIINKYFTGKLKKISQDQFLIVF